MEFAPFIIVLHVLTCLSRADGLFLKQTERAGNVSQLPNMGDLEMSRKLEELETSLKSLGHTVSSSRLSGGSFGHAGNSSPMIAPHRMPEECKSCSKHLDEDEEKVPYCSAMNSVCECCKKILEERTISMCKGFAEPLGQNYSAKNTHQDCLVVFSSAMEQRGESCDIRYDYQEANTGTTTKRFGDICDGSPPAGCDSELCGYWGCNGALKKTEVGYRAIAHYKGVYDGHPCKHAERKHTATKKRSAESRASLEAATAERTAAEKTAQEKVAAEKEAAKNAAVANAGFDHEKKEKAAAENEVNQKRLAEKTAKVALEYATAERQAAEKASRLRALSASLAGEEAAAAKVALEKATAEREEAEKAAGQKRQAEQEAAEHAGTHVADSKQAHTRTAFEKAEAKRKENAAIERGMAEDAFGFGLRRRRSDTNLAKRILPAQGVQRHNVTAKTSSAK